MKNIPFAILLLMAAVTPCSWGKEVKGGKIGPQEISATSSMQFYTCFALIRTMLEGKWDDKVFQQFTQYDGMNLQMMQRYEAEMGGDEKWGAFLRKKNTLHEKVYEELKPLVAKKRANKDLSQEDLLKLEALNKQIYETLIK